MIFKIFNYWVGSNADQALLAWWLWLSVTGPLFCRALNFSNWVAVWRVQRRCGDDAAWGSERGNI